MSAHERGDLRVTTIRPAYTYGEGQPLLSYWRRDDLLIDRLRKGKPIIVQGDGQSLWVCCHIEDVARAFIGALGNTVALGKAYHATGEEWMTWNQYYRAIASVIGAPPPDLVHIPTDLLAQVSPTRGKTALENFQFSNIFDNTAAHRDLGFRYSIPWKAGVRRVADWLESRERIGDSDEDTMDDRIVEAWRRAGKRMGVVEG
jgi:nucleoside-diphosphate-sugar epimerase